MLDVDWYDILRQTDVLTSIGDIHALTAWRRYNAGAVVEQRIEELPPGVGAARPPVRPKSAKSSLRCRIPVEYRRIIGLWPSPIGKPLLLNSYSCRYSDSASGEVGSFGMEPRRELNIDEML